LWCAYQILTSPSLLGFSTVGGKRNERNAGQG